MKRQLFVNIAVKDLKQTMAFFTTLGFEFNPKFTDDKAACMIVNDNAYFMLLTEPFFKTFTKRELCNTSTHSESLLAVSCPSRDAVDETFEKAIAAGGKEAGPAQDHGFMYYRTFHDLDGHHWEIMWMDPAAAAA